MRARDLLAVAVTKARELIQKEQDFARDLIEKAVEEDRLADEARDADLKKV